MVNLTLSPTGKLWHHRDFMHLWLSDTVSQIGNQFTQFALPILAHLLLGAESAELGLLFAVQILPFLTLGLFVGVWADRFQKRRIMVICNLGRMITLGSIPVAFVFGVLTLYQVYLVGFVSGVFTVFFDISYQAYLPILIDRSDLVEGNSKLQISASGAQVAGPTIAGLVYQAIGGALAIGIDAVGYLVSALSLYSIKKREPAKSQNPSNTGKSSSSSSNSDSSLFNNNNNYDNSQRSSISNSISTFFKEMKEGIHVVIDNPILRRIAGSTATSNLGSSIVAPVMIIFLLDNLGFSTVEIGLIGTAGSVGFLIGVLITPKVTHALGLGVTLAVSVGTGFLAMLNPLAQYGYSIFILSAISFAAGLLIPAYNINQISLRQAITENRLQGRMNATIRTIVWGTMPLGSIIGGILGSLIGVISTIYLGGFISGIAAFWIIFGPVIKLKQHPKSIQESTVQAG